METEREIKEKELVFSFSGSLHVDPSYKELIKNSLDTPEKQAEFLKEVLNSAIDNKYQKDIFDVVIKVY